MTIRTNWVKTALFSLAAITAGVSSADWLKGQSKVKRKNVPNTSTVMPTSAPMCFKCLLPAHSFLPIGFHKNARERIRLRDGLDEEALPGETGSAKRGSVPECGLGAHGLAGRTADEERRHDGEQRDDRAA